MTEQHKTESDHIAEARAKLLDAALIHVVFDGWSDATLRAAISDSGVEPGLARIVFPRGGVDMALAFHYQGDARLRDDLAQGALEDMGMTAKITHAVRRRLELVEGDKEAVRRGASLFALPIHAGDGTKALWHTADTIWSALGDTSTDYNWYTKRATLSAVYSSTVLYWLGDESMGQEATWAFLDRRIANVMQIEKAKAQFRKSPLAGIFNAGPGRILDRLNKPGTRGDMSLPGKLS
ncbi:ubiquinone biosynthesis protein COQ9 [Rubricella aquisinus]|uniref:Ubiquinone biosynthesis protein COQ9 n=1 Tax=Rubricella aquisinus TaxID=2028108 RepID=A0A840X7M1_9RHOB|nr:COQ9 family protein [Rubricella aquisinus]MBB5516707.1 ubiquinone biosynthesis protein COQ9 [Rubricella aquisinus]